MKLRRIKAQHKILAGILLVILGGVIFVVATRLNRHAAEISATPSPTMIKGNSTAGEPTPTTTPAPGASPATTPTPAPSTGPATVKEPVLQKSSGNAPGSSVPAGALVEFSCEDTAGLTCEVKLTNRNNPAQVVSLGQKTVTDNGRGQAFATWVWTAVAGSWNVTAVASNQSGGSAASAVQTLEVK